MGLETLLRRLIGRPDPARAPSAARRGAMARALTQRRTPLVHDRVPVILLYSEKSGCTSVVKWFFFQAGLYDEAIAHARWIHKYENEVYKRQEGYRPGVARAILAGDRPLVKFTRDPFKRAVSGFLMLSGPGMRNPDHFGHAEWKRIRQLKYGDPEHAGGASFRDFLEHVRTGAGQLGRTNPHFACQFRPEEAPFEVEHHPLEEMGEVFRGIEREHGLETPPEAMFESGHHRSYVKETQEDLAETEIHERTFFERDPPDYRCFYNPGTIALVQEIYAEDFARYGYSTEPPAR